MYTKVFRQIYDGTLADNWQALVTFQQLLILADDNGVVDMTIGAIHRTTGIPMEILQAGIETLEAPDHGSRTPDMEGRRIARMDEHRTWGWFLVNFRKYRQMVSRDEKKESDRARMAEKRLAEKPKEISGVANSREQSQVVADVAHTEAEAEEEAKNKKEQKQKTCVERSAERSLLEPDSPIVVCLITNTGQEYPITEAQVAEFAQLHPAVDVPQELRNMRAWCIGNRAKRKTSGGMMKFVVAWLGRAQNDSVSRGNRGPPRKPSVADRITGTVFTGTAEHDLPDALRYD